MDWGRRAYKTRCRFWKDSEEEAEIRWVEALPNAPTLPTWSAIQSLDLTAQPAMLDGVGEVFGALRSFTGQKAPAGLTGVNLCGSLEDFEQGGTYRPDLPPAPYDQFGYLACCQVPVPPPPPTPYVFSSTCFTGNAQVGTWYRSQLAPGNNFPNFCSVAAVNGQPYCIEWSVEGGPTPVRGEISYGFNCQAARYLLGPMPTPGRYSVASQFGPILWLDFRPQIYPMPPTWIIWRITAGLCST